MNRIFFTAASLAAGICTFTSQGSAFAHTPAPGSPQEVISGISVAELVSVLSGNGWEAEQWQEEEGQPSDLVYLKVGDYMSWARLKHCSGEVLRRCGTIVFFANFELGGRISASDKNIINQYNDTAIAGRAYYQLYPEEETDQAGVDLRVSLTGGVTNAYLKLEIQEWEYVLNTFVAGFRGG